MNVLKKCEKWLLKWGYSYRNIDSIFGYGDIIAASLDGPVEVIEGIGSGLIWLTWQTELFFVHKGPSGILLFVVYSELRASEAWLRIPFMLEQCFSKPPMVKNEFFVLCFSFNLLQTDVWFSSSHCMLSCHAGPQPPNSAEFARRPGWCPLTVNISKLILSIPVLSSPQTSNKQFAGWHQSVDPTLSIAVLWLCVYGVWSQVIWSSHIVGHHILICPDSDLVWITLWKLILCHEIEWSQVLAKSWVSALVTYDSSTAWGNWE